MPWPRRAARPARQPRRPRSKDRGAAEIRGVPAHRPALLRACPGRDAQHGPPARHGDLAVRDVSGDEGDDLRRRGRRHPSGPGPRGRARLLGTVISQFATYPEKKAMIFVGEGVDTRPGWEIWEKIEAI